MKLRFNREQIELAKKQLGITKPVRIRVVSFRHDGNVAWYQNINDEHYISLTTESADCNASLWHELAHAAQAERVPEGDKFQKIYRSLDGQGDAQLAYLNNELEVEARNIARANSQKQLIRWVKDNV